MKVGVTWLKCSCYLSNAVSCYHQRESGSTTNAGEGVQTVSRIRGGLCESDTTALG